MSRPRQVRPAIKCKASLLAVLAAVFSMAVMADEPNSAKDAIKAAESAISQAEEARVTNYASPELHSAHQKLAAAKEMSGKADDKKEFLRASWLAEEARSDAELAAAKSKKARAEGGNTEMQRNIDMLSQALQPK